MGVGIRTMKYSNLVKAYKNLCSQMEAVDGEREGESVLLIHETDWVQILLTYGPQHSEGVKLIVEVSIPTWVHDLSLSKPSNAISPNHNSQLQRVLSEQIHHLEYLLKLSKVGFRLTIIPEEGIWNAWINLDHSPSQQLFEVLSPP